MLDLAFSQISISNILELPAIVMVPGMAVIALFVISALRSLFSLRIIRAFTSLVSAYVIALILSQAGDAIVQYLMFQGIINEGAMLTFPVAFENTAAG